MRGAGERQGAAGKVGLSEKSGLQNVLKTPLAILLIHVKTNVHSKLKDEYRIVINYVFGYLVHLPATFICEFSVRAGSGLKERGRKSWQPKLPGDFVGCMSFS